MHSTTSGAFCAQQVVSGLPPSSPLHTSPSSIPPSSSPQPAERRGAGGGRERFPPLSISHTARIPADKKRVGRRGPDVACRTLLPLLHKGFSFKKHPPVLFGILPQGPNCLLERKVAKLNPPPKKKVPGIPASISGRKSREKTNIGSGKVGPKHKQPKKERGRLEPETSEEREKERERSCGKGEESPINTRQEEISPQRDLTNFH